ncbi:DeoR family transcriptional regulator [Halobacillus sp. ACCC02827]|nr:DeoR family transcriptional regulator [Halobacillus sp. ACCC02827]WJE17655.1 DeoR family transcriptional regulator [Halobacillus sp. ACCC02827]
MLPIERRKQILTWLEKEEFLRVSTISRRLDVSEMTVYRDLKPLIEAEEVKKAANGITLAAGESSSSNGCPYCLKETTSRLACQIIKRNQQIETTCCVHCALLRYEDLQEEVVQVIARDFLLDTTISAKTATFLLHSDAGIHCCHPQPIIFASRHQAEKFRKGFGGELHTFDSAKTTIIKEMNGDCCSDRK